MDVPDLRVVPQELDFLLRLFGRLAAVLTEGLELQEKEQFSRFSRAHAPSRSESREIKYGESERQDVDPYHTPETQQYR